MHFVLGILLVALAIYIWIKAYLFGRIVMFLLVGAVTTAVAIGLGDQPPVAFLVGGVGLVLAFGIANAPYWLTADARRVTEADGPGK